MSDRWRTVMLLTGGGMIASAAGRSYNQIHRYVLCVEQERPVTIDYLIVSLRYRFIRSQWPRKRLASELANVDKHNIIWAHIYQTSTEYTEDIIHSWTIGITVVVFLYEKIALIYITFI